MTNTVKWQKVLIGLLGVISLGCLVLAKLRNFPVLYGVFIFSVLLLLYLIVGKGIVFDIFKNSKVPEKYKSYLLITLFVLATNLMINIINSDWLNLIICTVLFGSLSMIHINNIKKAIKEK